MGTVIILQSKNKKRRYKT